jgi:hypothetical protein
VRELETTRWRNLHAAVTVLVLSVLQRYIEEEEGEAGEPFVVAARPRHDAGTRLWLRAKPKPGTMRWSNAG